MNTHVASDNYLPLDVEDGSLDESEEEDQSICRFVELAGLSLLLATGGKDKDENDDNDSIDSYAVDSLKPIKSGVDSSKINQTKQNRFPKLGRYSSVDSYAENSVVLYAKKQSRIEKNNKSSNIRHYQSSLWMDHSDNIDRDSNESYEEERGSDHLDRCDDIEKQSQQEGCNSWHNHRRCNSFVSTSTTDSIVCSKCRRNCCSNNNNFRPWDNYEENVTGVCKHSSSSADYDLNSKTLDHIITNKGKKSSFMNNNHHSVPSIFSSPEPINAGGAGRAA